jgi:phosphoribosylaminoimidazolecarboxamide formyltransferase/IMP cyclohydrolase
VQLGIEPIDLLVCNLYPFEAVAKSNPEWAELIENIDIGGPTLIRAAAKNYASVTVVTSPEQYSLIEPEMGLETRSLLAMEAFRHTARYDGLIAAKLEEKLTAEERTIVLSPKGAQKLRYGENPHQKSWVYMDPFHPGLASCTPLQGKELSYNNLLDADAAWRSCGDVGASGNKHYDAAVSIIKHLTPCGIALSDTPLEALKLAWAGDTVSAFGGILCFNKEVDKTIAKWLGDKFVEVILAPSFAADALEVFAAKKNLRLIAMPSYDGAYRPPMIKSISGGFVVQQEDTGYDSELRQMTSKQFPADKKDIAHFGVMACKHLKSNAIGLFVAQKTGLSMIGAGMGNPNRLISVRQAIEKAHENGYKDLSQAVLVSDAFFPFPDNIDLAKQAGIKAIVQPGGSVKDKDVIAAANDAGIAMVFTGRRHFRH